MKEAAQIRHDTLRTGILSPLPLREIYNKYAPSYQQVHQTRLLTSGSIFVGIQVRGNGKPSDYVKDLSWMDSIYKLGYLKAVVEFGLRKDDLGPEFREYLRELIKTQL